MIRHALMKDVPAILAMVTEFYKTTDYKEFAPFDEDTVVDLIECLILHHICIVVTNEGDVPVGVTAFMFTPFAFNRNILSCVEAVWWVNPSHRNSTNALKMVQYADKLRKLRGATHFQIARLNTSPERLDRVFESLGFNFSEKYFSKVD